MDKVLRLFLILYLHLQDASVVVHNPPNTQSVELYFRGEKMAKVSMIYCFVLLHE